MRFFRNLFAPRPELWFNNHMSDEQRQFRMPSVSDRPSARPADESHGYDPDNQASGATPRSAAVRAGRDRRGRGGGIRRHRRPQPESRLAAADPDGPDSAKRPRNGVACIPAEGICSKGGSGRRRLTDGFTVRRRSSRRSRRRHPISVSIILSPGKGGRCFASFIATDAAGRYLGPSAVSLRWKR